MPKKEATRPTGNVSSDALKPATDAGQFSESESYPQANRKIKEEKVTIDALIQHLDLSID